MSDNFVFAFLEKLTLLEKSAGQAVQYRIMPPLQGTQDIISIQKIAKDIAEFIGLDKLVFDVSYIKQQPNVGGSIEKTQSGNMVFIEISPNVTQHPLSVFTTLCHEISHKWLQSRGISAINDYDNEILTDITAVFLGFGKIMLNGCEENTTTNTIRVGYLNRDQLAFTYSLICSMRKISREESLEGLTKESLSSIKVCHMNYGSYFDLKYHIPDFGEDRLFKFKKQIRNIQFQLAVLDKFSTYLKRILIDPLSNFYDQTHQILNNLVQSAEKKKQESNSFDPALRYLNLLKLDMDFNKIMTDIEERRKNADGLVNTYSNVISPIIQNNYFKSSEDPDIHSLIICPIDKTQIRLPDNSGDILVKCPKCNYEFVYNTNSLTQGKNGNIRKQ